LNEFNDTKQICKEPNVIRLSFPPFTLSRYSIQTLIYKKGQANELKNNGQWKSKPKKFQQHWQCNNLLLGYGPL
jgi:hypothetical protein